MKLFHAIPPELQALIDQWLDEAISDDDLKRLEDLLRGDAAAQAFFRRYCQLHINLDTATRIERAIDAFKRRESQTVVPPLRAVSSVQISDGHVPALASSAHRGRTRWRTLALCASLVGIALSAGVLVRMMSRPGRHDPLRVQHIQLATAESRDMTLENVGTLVIEGPADLDLVGNSRARLRRGRVRIRITSESARGFVVETPRGPVTDLGTEFGVDVAGDAVTGVVVFEGVVEWAVHNGRDLAKVDVQRLVQGEGVVVGEAGRVDRIMSIVTGPDKIFRRSDEPADDGITPVISDVRDNIRVSVSKQFYEIVPGGMQEDALCYVDRPGHDWNGMDTRGMPSYLIGADYVKTFCDDKVRKDLMIEVTLSRPARLFVIMDDRVTPPDWLRRDFHDTGDDVGQDDGPAVFNGRNYHFHRGFGPGNEVDYRHSIWQRIVDHPGVVELGPNSGASWDTGMYGIAAVALDADPAHIVGIEQQHMSGNEEPGNLE